MVSVPPIYSIPKENFQEVTDYLALSDLRNLGDMDSNANRLVVEVVRKKGKAIFDFIQDINRKKSRFQRLSPFLLRNIQDLLNSTETSKVVQAHNLMNIVWMELFSKGTPKMERKQ